VQLKIELKRGIDNMPVEAYVVDLSQKHLDDFQNLWLEQLRAFKQEDKYWDWSFKLSFIEMEDSYEGYAIECEDKTQGLMVIETAMHGSRIDPGKRLVYITRLVSAPFNRAEIQNPPQYKKVGTVLLKWARFRSVELKYGGRVGLHSLPNSEGFYEGKNMINCGKDEDEELVYFEYPPLVRR
jgi:hypothetical protein